MRGLYFKIALPNVTTLPYYSNQYFTNDVNYTGNAVTIRAASGGAVVETPVFKREGFQVTSFSQATGINSYEPGGCTIEFDNFNGNWQTVVSGANLRGCYVYVYCLEANGEIYTDNRLATFLIKNWSIPSPLKFQLDLTDDSPDRNADGMPVITIDGKYQFPTVVDAGLNQYINIGAGDFTYGWAESYGGMAMGYRADMTIDAVTCHYLCAITPTDASIEITRVWVNGEEPTVGTWEAHYYTGYFANGADATICYVRWLTTIPTGQDTINFEMNYTGTPIDVTETTSILINAISGFEAMDYSSTKNTAFETEIERRGSHYDFAVSYQEKKTAGDLLNDLIGSIGLSRWRINRKRQLELITYTPGNITADYTLGQADVKEMKVKSNHDGIENIFDYKYGYIPQSDSNMFSGSFPSWNKKRSEDIYGKLKSSENKLLRWVYGEQAARIVSVYDSIDRCLPRIEVSAVLNDDTCTPLLQPGDIVKIKHPDAIDKGSDYRYYQIESLQRDFVDGGINCEMIDIDHIADMEYSRKLSLQPQLAGQDFINSSIAHYNNNDIENNGSSKMVIAADATALSGFSWKTNGSPGDAHLRWIVSATNNFGNILNFTNYCVSFRMKLTDTATGQVMCCCSKYSGADDYWRINYNSSLKRLGFVLYIGGVSTVACTTANNSYTDTNWHHIVFQKRGTTFEIYIDDVMSGSTTSSATNAITGNMYIGALYTASGGISLPFLGYMEEFHISHEANPWNCNGSTCIALTAPRTWFGINNTWPYYGTPS